MPATLLERRSPAEQTEFNLRRWEQLVDDPDLARIDERIETDRNGNLILSPIPSQTHGSYQSEVAYLLRQLMGHGRVITECPISTSEGVRAADLAWASPESVRAAGDAVCYLRSPEICVEVISPSNTKSEIHEKMALYFAAGAQEVWTCSDTGKMTFYAAGAIIIPQSHLCPAFPKKVDLN